QSWGGLGDPFVANKVSGEKVRVGEQNDIWPSQD
ncbi:MAG: hypothetical protein RL198_879, partial [Actinomycetota bacterium]